MASSGMGTALIGLAATAAAAGAAFLAGSSLVRTSNEIMESLQLHMEQDAAKSDRYALGNPPRPQTAASFSALCCITGRIGPD